MSHNAGMASIHAAALVWLIPALLLAACQPLLTPVPGVDQADGIPTVISAEGSQVDVSMEDSRTVLDVYSQTGIGSAEVAMESMPGADLLLRLHLAGLEELRFAYDGVEVTASVASGGDLVNRQRVAVDGDEGQFVDPMSKYWLDIAVLDEHGEPAMAIPLENGHFLVAPPADFMQGGFDSFAIAWIDFYR